MTDELRDSARKVLAGLGLPADAAATWRQIVELGWLLVSVPEELGGLGQGLAGACALYRELGGSLAAAPFLPAMLAMEAFSQAGAADWIERLAGDGFVSAPLAESKITAGKALTGLASAVPSADEASHVVISAAGGACVALVPLDAPGVEIRYRPSWDTTRRLFDIRLNSVSLTECVVMAHGPDAEGLSQNLATHRDFALAADSVGGAIALLDRTVEYLMTRRQFGRPLALFQALKHRCADLKALTSAAEALLLDSLGRPAEPGLLGPQVKSFATAAYARVAEEALRLHGGIGMTAEYSCHFFLKRALLNVQLGQSNDACDLAVAAGALRDL